MTYISSLTPRDRQLAADGLSGFLPDEIYDIHVHPYRERDFAPGAWPFLAGHPELGCRDHRAALQRYMSSRTIHGLYFGMPKTSADRPAMNDWVAAEVQAHGTPLSRALLVASPADDREAVAAALRSGRFCGIKVYHCYANRPDTMQAALEEYAPEWMWEILHEVRGVLLLHIVRDEAIADAGNQTALRRRPDPVTGRGYAVFTGDRGMLDDQGRLSLGDRIDRMVKVMGLSASPLAIETLLRDQPGVTAAAVVALPHEILGAELVALLVGGDPRQAEAACRAGLPPHERPRRILPRAALPLTASGKVDYPALLRALAGTYPSKTA